MIPTVANLSGDVKCTPPTARAYRQASLGAWQSKLNGYLFKSVVT